MKRTIAFGLLAILLSACGEVSMPAPDGPYPVGIAVVDMEDPSRPADPRDTNHAVYAFSARVWYPAASTNGLRRLASTEKELADAMVNYQGMPRFMMEMMDGNALTECWENAPATNLAAPWPVVIFNHGGFSFERQNMTMLSRLASHGYVVIAISQPGLSLLTRYQNGSCVTVDPAMHAYMTNYYASKTDEYNRTMIEAIRMNREAGDDNARLEALKLISKVEFYRYLRTVSETILRNNLYLIRNLDNIARATGARPDAGNVSVTGHSLGGIVAGEIAMLGLPQVRACVNFDGVQFVYDEPKTLKSPALFFYSTEQKMGNATLDFSGINRYFQNTSERDCYELTVRGTAHMSFSDLTYITPLRLMGMTGSIDGERAGKIISDYTLAFLDRYQKGKDSPLLANAPAEWPEVEMTAKRK